MPTPLEQFIQQVSARAQQLGLRSIVVAYRDPTSRGAVVVSSPGALTDLKDALAEKLKLPQATLGYTSWD